MLHQFMKERNLCEYSFCRKSNMKAHTKAVHDKQKNFKCDICDFSSSWKDVVEKYVPSVHEKRSIFNVKFVTTALLQKNI